MHRPLLLTATALMAGGACLAHAADVWVSPDGTATIREERTDSGWRRIAPPVPYTPTEQGDWGRPAPVMPRGGYATDVDASDPHGYWVRPERPALRRDRGEVIWNEGPVYWVRSQTHYVAWHRDEAPKVVYKYIEKPKAKKKPARAAKAAKTYKADTIRCTCK